MRQSALQEYLQTLCKNYYLAREEMKRLEEVKDADVIKDWENKYGFWNERVCYAKNEIEEVIKLFVDCKMTFHITTEKEIFALLSFFYNRKIQMYPIINVFQNSPKDLDTDMFEEFLQAYKVQSDEKMQEMYEKYVV